MEMLGQAGNSEPINSASFAVPNLPDVGAVVVEGVDDGVGRPQEDAGVPEKLAALHKHLCQLFVGLFGECLDFRDAVFNLVLADLDVAVARFRTVGLDAEGQQSAALARQEVEAFDHAVAECVFFEYQVVGWGDEHHRVGIDGADVVGCPGDTRCRVAAVGLKKYLVVGKVGELLFHQRGVAFVGDGEDVSDRHEFCNSVKTHLQQRSACAEKVYKLLGGRRFAERPEPASDSAAHNHTISVFHHCIDALFIVFLR